MILDPKSEGLMQHKSHFRINFRPNGGQYTNIRLIAIDSFQKSILALTLRCP